MNCTACPALRYPLSHGVCAMGYKTASKSVNGYRVRHPLETCERPQTDADVVTRLGIIARERAE